jgi:alpha-L-fucosidase
MKFIQGLYIALLILICGFDSFGQEKNAYLHRQNRTKWFRDARFGLFIHWGIYAVPSRGEWVKFHEKMTDEEYDLYFREFNPTDYNPQRWAKIAKQAGMKYAVITAKHHDGFCLFDSRYTDYKATNTPAGRDLIKEFTNAFRAEGLKVGFYYSLIDWHHPGYPVEGDCVIHPMTGKAGFRNDKRDFSEYVKYLHNQTRELLTEYGKIDIMWFDFSCGDMTGEKWEASRLVKMVRKLQPHVIIDNRLGGRMEIEDPEIYAGDFEGPEQIIPKSQITDKHGRPIPWEACITLNNEWGYARNDNNYKSSEDIVKTLVNCVSKGGNLLLNIGPDARGRFPEQSVKILTDVGEWMNENNESIYGCGPAGFPKPEWGRYTQNGNVLYAHIMEQGIGQICLPGLKGRINSASLLSDNSEVFFGDFWHGERYYIDSADLFINFIKKPAQHTILLPSQINTVVKLILKQE